MSYIDAKTRVAAAIKMKSVPQYPGDFEAFDPWRDVLQDSITGSYDDTCSEVFIDALLYLQSTHSDRISIDFSKRWGLAGSLAIYVLEANGLVNYGTSPTAGWPHEDVAPMWEALINKWMLYVRYGQFESA